MISLAAPVLGVKVAVGAVGMVGEWRVNAASQWHCVMAGVVVVVSVVVVAWHHLSWKS